MIRRKQLAFHSSLESKLKWATFGFMLNLVALAFIAGSLI